MRVVPVPVRSDNYAYLLIDDATNHTAVVDPYDVARVEAALKREGVPAERVNAILTTHHHDDHAGGNKEFVKKYPGVTVYGGSSRVAALTKQVKDRDMLKIGDIEIACMATPCHTQDSICFNTTDSKTGQRGVFTGDTLFIGGCGRFFEGTPEEMINSLAYLGSLPDDTIVYNGHEYTSGNVAFGLSVDQGNEAIKQLQKLAENEKITTGRTTIGEEKGWNIFMRLETEAIRDATGEKDAIAAMGKLREMKNTF